jgi:hypothetical protein
MDQAAKVFYEYSPPKPELIQSSQDAKKSLLKAVEPGRRVRLEFRDYFKTGDLLGVELDIVDNRILDLQVSSSLDSSKGHVRARSAFSLLLQMVQLPGAGDARSEGHENQNKGGKFQVSQDRTVISFECFLKSLAL